MKVVRRNSLVPEFNALVNNFLGGDVHVGASGFYSGQKTMPAVNIKETEDAFQIQLAAPGLEKDDFKVEVDKGVLTISSEKENPDMETYSKCEFSFGKFSRSFALPKSEIDDSKISASYKNGLLELHLAKKEEVKPKPARFIEIA